MPYMERIEESKLDMPLTKLREIGYDKPFSSVEKGVNDYVNNHILKSDPYV